MCVCVTVGIHHTLVMRGSLVIAKDNLVRHCLNMARKYHVASALLRLGDW